MAVIELAAIDFQTIIVILVFAAPLLEKILTRGRKPPEAPPKEMPSPRKPYQQRPMRPLPPRLPTPERARTGLPVPTPEREKPGLPVPTRGDASDMLPDDLWELITGQKRPRTLPSQPKSTHTHPAESTHSYDEEAVDEEAFATREQQPSREASLPARIPAGEYVPVHAPPVVISLEDNIPTDEQRHVQFHERVTHLAPPARMKVETVPLAAMLASNSALRQAFVMSEVFGKPKGLE
jgi:hypothetical protein